MEEIKLPKFKTKEELEEFAKNQAKEIEALKDVIKLKDATINEQIKATRGYLHMSEELVLTKKMLKDARDVNEKLKNKCDNIDYKEKYEICKSWLDKEYEISAKLRGENFSFSLRSEKFETICNKLVNMMPFYKREAAKKLIDSIF